MKKFICLAFATIISLSVVAQITGLKFDLVDGGKRDINLEKYNRLAFGSDSFILYSSTDASIPKLEISYDEISSITVKYNENSGVVSEVINPDVEIIHDGGSIYVGNTDTTDDWTIAVYSGKGELLRISKGTCDVSDIVPGIYIAVAYNGNKICTKKIIR